HENVRANPRRIPTSSRVWGSSIAAVIATSAALGNKAHPLHKWGKLADAPLLALGAAKHASILPRASFVLAWLWATRRIAEKAAFPARSDPMSRGYRTTRASTPRNSYGVAAPEPHRCAHSVSSITIEGARNQDHPHGPDPGHT